jgi:hypothetical protein
MLLVKATELLMKRRLCYFALIGPDASSVGGGVRLVGLGVPKLSSATASKVIRHPRVN